MAGAFLVAPRPPYSRSPGGPDSAPTPASVLPELRRGKQGRGQEQARRGLAPVLGPAEGLPGVRGGTIADPASWEPPGVSRSHLPPHLLQVQPGGGLGSAAPTRGQRGAARGEAGGTRRRLQGAPPGLLIHSHPRSLRRGPCPAPRPSRPASRGGPGKNPSPNLAGSSRSTLISTFLSFLLSPDLLSADSEWAAGGGPGRGGGTPAAARSAAPPGRRPQRLPRPSSRHKGGDTSPGPRAGSLPTQCRALTPSRRRRRSPDPAGCSTPPAASPGKRGRRARFLLGFLRRSPSSSPAAGVSGRRAPGLGRRGGGSGSTTTWPPGAGPRRPGSSGSGKGGANHSPPIPPRAAPNSASQVTRPRALAGTCGGCSPPSSPRRILRARASRLFVACF